MMMINGRFLIISETRAGKHKSAEDLLHIKLINDHIIKTWKAMKAKNTSVLNSRFTA